MTPCFRLASLPLSLLLAPALLHAGTATVAPMPTDAELNASYDPEGHLQKKAKKIVADGVTLKKMNADGTITTTRADFDGLTAKEEKAVILAIAQKLRNIRKQNWKSFWKRGFKGGKYKSSLSDAEITIYLEPDDLKELKSDFSEDIGTAKPISQNEAEHKNDPKEVPTEPKPVLIEQHSEPKYENLFADNQWEIVEEVTKGPNKGEKPAQDLRDQLDAVIKVLKSGKDGKITGLTIRSSASTLSNTVDDPKTGKPMTWEELSKRRYMAAMTFVVSYLAKNGFPLSPEVVKKIQEEEKAPDPTDRPWAGSNDGPNLGTSGPSAPIVNGKRIGGVIGDGSDALQLGPGENEDTYQELYAPYRFVDVNIMGSVMQLNPDEPTTTFVPQESDFTSRLVKLDIKTDSKKRWWKRKHKIHIKFLHFHHKPKRFKKGKGKLIPCPDFTKG